MIYREMLPCPKAKADYCIRRRSISPAGRVNLIENTVKDHIGNARLERVLGQPGVAVVHGAGRHERRTWHSLQWRTRDLPDKPLVSRDSLESKAQALLPPTMFAFFAANIVGRGMISHAAAVRT
jgi:hypothetical protein